MNTYNLTFSQNTFTVKVQNFARITEVQVGGKWYPAAKVLSRTLLTALQQSLTTQKD